MSSYEYECGRCGLRFNRMVNDHRRVDGVDCENCEQPTRRLVSSVVIFVNEESAVWITDKAGLPAGAGPERASGGGQDQIRGPERMSIRDVPASYVRPAGFGSRTG